MSDDNVKTNPSPSEFDFSAHPSNSLFYDRRTGSERRTREASKEAHQEAVPQDTARERRAKKERRRRIDPTTFDKQYTDDEMEFMNAMQRFKELTGKAFPTHGEVLKIAAELGYRRIVVEPDQFWEESETDDDPSSIVETSSVDA
jgi:hypothetical protein